jgi:tetratricopeptide (TPR) repeat protein
LAGVIRGASRPAVVRDIRAAWPFFVSVVALVFVTNVLGADKVLGKRNRPPAFGDAIELIHAYRGNGPQLEQAWEIAQQLSRSHPKSGLAQTLMAESMSTWALDQSGEPNEVYLQVLRLADAALAMDASLAEARVAKGRALLRASQYEAALAQANAALAIDRNLSGALFVLAEVHRRNDRRVQAEDAYHRFIASASSIQRKGNGYYWLGKMYDDAAWRSRGADQSELVAKARKAYEQAVATSPEGAWNQVNFAIFLNNIAADFPAAEQHARRALDLMEFPMARYHLAASQYQQLWSRREAVKPADAAMQVAVIGTSTGVSLESALKFEAFGGLILGRLQELNALAQRRHR